ncbi:MAG: PRC-barrel domain containing protein [Chitinophagaceae bacterium]|nr:MAG: PRC-barrel domain containing protein [Chitinophagaceae bacterium]
MAEGNRHTRLQKLNGSGVELTGQDPDIRSWIVKDNEGRLIGIVDDLVFDLQDEKVRYIVVDSGKNDFNLPARQVLVPVGVAEIHEEADDVILNGITHRELSALPDYDETRFDTEHEESVFNVFGGLGASAINGGGEHDREFYDHEHFNPENLYRNRRSRDML